MPKVASVAERLTKASIAKLSTTGARYRVRDLAAEGLLLVVEATGRKHWIVRDMGADGRQHERALGAYPALLPEIAREEGAMVRTSIGSKAPRAPHSTLTKGRK